jgi:hypothetical protein
MELRQRAQEAFEAARHKSNLKSVMTRIMGKNHQLRSFASFQQQIHQHVPRTLQTIRIDVINGSVGREHDFDRQFSPRVDYVRERWIAIEIAFLEGRSLPPIELYKVCNDYFVVDGHHRISVFRSHGQEFIEAYVTEMINICLN